ncbi:TPA: hypothetical protein IBL02_004379 [Escherichia coli]|uniref:Uncharacterized protein n=1 Tax=Escherichia coli TaxID=562 RepID=A0AAX0KAD9_ECOLX|nr:hypothetical protein [Escherichia coli]OSL71799.1 hypothetical protein EAWG_03098 [Escherichia coli TA008]EFA4737826.1 hypothetical protein [Escherichia coli]EFB2927517.1 hypothetical protein [Escherichia coli]EFB8892288.1 hypothetical protein [Escherichia coli]EFC5186172.1 hypothetical protein [Escherichia coli]
MSKTFEQMKLNFIYLHELWLLTHSIKTRCEELFHETPLPDAGYYFKIDYNIHILINSILSDAANVKKLIAVPKNKTREESPEQFRLHIERSNYLQQKIKDIEIKEINSVRVRNTLQHFDEYLDQLNIDVTAGKMKGHDIAVYNFVISHWKAINPRPYPIRLYVCEEKTYYNMKASINLEKVYNEAFQVNEVIRKEINKEAGAEPGSFMVPLNF